MSKGVSEWSGLIRDKGRIVRAPVDQVHIWHRTSITGHAITAVDTRREGRWIPSRVPASVRSSGGIGTLCAAHAARASELMHHCVNGCAAADCGPFHDTVSAKLFLSTSSTFVLWGADGIEGPGEVCRRVGVVSRGRFSEVSHEAECGERLEAESTAMLAGVDGEAIEGIAGRAYSTGQNNSPHSADRRRVVWACRALIRMVFWVKGWVERRTAIPVQGRV